MTGPALRGLLVASALLSCGPAFAAALPFGQAQTGTINTAAQINAYTFTANANDVVDIELVATSGAYIPKIQLFDPNNHSVTSTYAGSPFSCSGTSVELKTVQLTTAGTYTVNVTDCNGTDTGGYSIYAQRTNNPTGATPLSYGATATGNIGAAAQSNTYTITANANDVADFTLVTTSGSMVPEVRLYNPNGALVKSNYAGSPFSCSGLTVEMNTVTLPVSGIYTVLVSDCSNLTTGNYSIYTQLTDNPAGPSALNPGQVQTGSIGATAASNTYTLNATANDVVDFTVVATSGGLIPKILVYNPNGALVNSTYAGSPFSCSGLTLELNTVTLPVTGIYTVLVRDCNDTNTGAYSVYSQRTNNPALSSNLPLAQQQAGLIASPAGANVYTFSATANDVYDISVGTSSGSLIPKIRVYQPNGSLVSSTYAGTPFGCSGSWIDMSAVTLPVTGTYSVFITDCGDTFTGNYAIYSQRTSSPFDAGTLQWGASQPGTISAAAQSNTYTVAGGNGDSVTLTLTQNSGGFIPKIRIYKPDGTLLSSTYAGSPFSCSGTSAKINALTLPGSGNYTVLASDCSNLNTGTYNLAMQCVGACPATLGPPGQVTTFSPGQGVTGVSTSTALSWGAASGATSYTVFFGTTNPPPSAGSTSSLSYTPPALSPNTTYYWSVTAINAQGSTPSATWSFTTAGAGGSCTLGLSSLNATVPATGTSTSETCPNNSGQPNCGVLPEVPRSFTVTPSGSCGSWTATSSNPGFLQITGGSSGTGLGTVSYTLVNNTHNSTQSYTITVASGSASQVFTVSQTGSGDNEVYRQVYALYEQLLGRDPDGPGFGFWTGSGGAGLGQMADSFLTSPEAFNSDFAVMATYQAANGTPPTYAQYAAAVPKIRNNTLTVTQLFNSLIGGSYSANTLYQNLLNRAPTGSEVTNANSAGLAATFEALIGYPNSATPVNSPNNEFQNTGIYASGPDHSNALYMQMVYYVTVSRDPDPAGLAFWVGIANNGGPGLLFQGSAGFAARIQILGPGTPNQGFIGSPEFQDLFAN